VINEQSNKTVWVMHPDDNVPVEATKTGYYLQNGRAIGLELQFPDGRRVGFTYDEIRSSMAQAAEIF
jgi:hypothetical protein